MFIFNELTNFKQPNHENTSLQAYKPTSLQAYKPTSLQAYKPTSLQAYKATIHNALVKYNAYIEAKGVTGVHGANIWVLGGNNFRGATLMMNKYTWSTTYNAMLAGWLGYLGPFTFPLVNELNHLFGHLYPDITFTLNDKNTQRIDQIVFHEAGHFSHAVKAGGGFWGIIVNRELDNIINGNGRPYGDGNDTSLWSGQFISLVEGWGTFTEYAAMRGYYPTDKDGYYLNSYMERFNMYTVPMSINYDENDSWFLTGLIWDIFDNHSSETNSFLRDGQTNDKLGDIEDHLNLGYNDTWYGAVYNRLDNSVHTGFELKAALINAASSSHTTEINQLFNSYGY